MHFTNSKLFLAACWTFLSLACFILVADIFTGLTNGLRTKAAERVQSSTPVMDCDPEFATCDTTPLPQVDELTDVTLPALAIMAVPLVVVIIAWLYRPDSKK